MVGLVLPDPAKLCSATVPAAVPSVAHTAVVWDTLLDTWNKASPLPNAVKSPAVLPAKPGAVSASATVPAAVPSLIQTADWDALP